MGSNSSNRATPDAAKSETDQLIRTVMLDQERVIKRQSLPELEPVEDEPTPEPRRRLLTLQRKREEPPKPRKVTKIPRIKIRRKHVVLAALATVFFFRPWLIPGILFVSFWIGLIAYLTVGPDRIHEKLADAWAWLLRTRPEKAERLRQTADRFALKFDAFLDRLPDRWAEKLALPDLSQPAANQANAEDAPDPFDKLKKMPEVYRG